jgi:exopolysaccharide production protein ExoQ
VQRFERIALFLMLLLATGAGESFLAGTDTTVSSGSEPVIQVGFGLMYVTLFLFLATRLRHAAWFLVCKERWTAVLCLWVLVSTAWSVEPGETVRRALALVGTSMAGLYIGMRYEPKQQLRIVAASVGLGAIASLVVVLLFPGIGITPEGSWQGVFFPKNYLGRAMALGALCFLLLVIGQRRRRVIRVMMFLLCCALLVLSKSATAVVVSSLIFLLLPFRKVLLLRNRLLVPFVTALALMAVPAGLWVMGNLDSILRGLGRESTLTGRIPLWQIVEKEIAARPVLGYGFSAFWKSQEADRIREVITWDAPHAHNGFLETMLGIGLIGVAILTIGLLRNLYLGLSAARARKEIDQAWPLFFLIFTVLYNLTESSFMSVNSILWMVYVANSFWLVRTRLEDEQDGGEGEDNVEESDEYPEYAYSR